MDSTGFAFVKYDLYIDYKLTYFFEKTGIYFYAFVQRNEYFL